MKEDLELPGTQGITFMLHFNKWGKIDKIDQIVPKFEYANPAQQNGIFSSQSHYTNQCAGLVVTWGVYRSWFKIST